MLFLMLAAMLMASVEMEHLKHVVKRSEACYAELGCFSDDSPFWSIQRPLSVLPQSPDKILTMFVLYTRESKDKPEVLDARHLRNITKQWTHFKARPTKILIHGFIDRISQTKWWQEVTAELLKHGNYNVIIVDWSSGNWPPYTQATANTRVVGAQTSVLVKALISAYRLKPKVFHIIGHSLGAHTAGYAGERIPGLARITGLDPAGPYFEDTDKAVRLDESDALYVDVIHTNGEPLYKLGQGSRTPSGHVDFFPNLGHEQPGCTVTAVVENIEQFKLLGGMLETVGCSHLRAVHYFNESINSKCPFKAVPCASEEDFENSKCQTCTSSGCGIMGFHADKNKPPSGQLIKYYLTTAESDSFCQYHFTVTIKFSGGSWSDVDGDVNLVINGEVAKYERINVTERTITPDKTYIFNRQVPSDFGNVNSVTLYWKQTSSFLSDLLPWSFWSSEPKYTVYLEKITVYRLEADVNVNFCADNKAIDSGNSLTLTKKC